MREQRDNGLQANIAVYLFGGLRVRLGNRDITRFRTQKTASLLAYLALQTSRPSSREVLIEMFWPGEGNGRMSLSGALSSLRQQLEPPHVASPGSALIADRMTVVFAPGAVATDVARFESLLGLARAAERQGEPLQQRALLVEAVRLYDQNAPRAPGLLPGFYDDWVTQLQPRFADMYSRALRTLAALHEDQDASGEALDCLSRVALLNPWDEDVTGEIRRLQTGAFPVVLKAAAFAVAAAPAQNADPPRAVRVAAPQRATAVTPPAPLSQAQSQTATALLAPSVPDPFEPSHSPLPLPFTRFFGREGDLMHLRWAMGTGAQRLITLTGPGGVGKTRLALEVAELLQEEDPEPRKKRLVIYAPLAGVTDVADLPGALMTIISGALPNLTFVASASTATAAKAPGNTQNQAPFQNDALPSLIDVLRKAPFSCVLILDNFEHLADEGAPFIERLLQQVPRLSCLITSRLKTGISGERAYPVAPLLAPPSDNGNALWSNVSDQATDMDPPKPGQNPLASLLQNDPALALFVDRAQATRTDFQLTHRNAASVHALVAHLEGIPLALELAAARMSLLTPQQILDELNNSRFGLLTSRRPGRPASRRGAVGGGVNNGVNDNENFVDSDGDPVRARHRSLWDTLAWSYRLLPADLQAVWAALSVFRGGWTIEAAQAICAPLYEKGAQNSCLLDDLAYLCDASLIQAAEVTGAPPLPDAAEEATESQMRFSMLETLRDFASEQAAIALGAESAARRHADYFLLVAEAENARLQGKEQAGALAHLSRERDNLRAAIAWAENGQSSDAARLHLALATALHRYFWIRGPVATGRAYLDVALLRLGAFPEQIAASPAVADALSAAGLLALRQGDTDTAEARLSDCLRLRCEQIDLRGMAVAQNNLAIIYSERGDTERARAFYAESLARWRDLRETPNIAVALANLGGIALLQDDLDNAKRLLTESFALSQSLGDTRGQADTLRNLGELAQRRGDRVEARRLYRQTLPLLEKIEDRLGLACSLLNLGFALTPDHTEASNRLIGAALAQYQAQGAELTREWQAELERQTAISHATIGEAATDAARRQGAMEPLQRIVDIAMQD